MKKLLLILSVILVNSTAFSQNLEKESVLKFQKELNEEYQNKETTPLRDDNFTNFKEHPFFPINTKYQVIAKLVRTLDAKPIEFPTSSGKIKYYTEFGKAYFNIAGKPQVLTLYTSESLKSNDDYKDYLFLPFKDATNNKQTYGGGRYLDLKIPQGDEIIIDFNKAYQPYCAYNAYDYNCPIVPENNQLGIAIKAGVKYKDIYHH